MTLNGECGWEYIGNQRIRIPPGQSQDRLRILINLCHHFGFCDECRWNYILNQDEVVGSNPTDSNRRDRSSGVERVICFINFVVTLLSRRMRGKLHGPVGCRFESGLRSEKNGVAQMVEQRACFSKFCRHVLMPAGRICRPAPGE